MLYRAKIGVAGTPTQAFREAVPHLQQELEGRTYLRRPSVQWDDAAQGITVEVEYKARDAELAQLALGDDLSDAIEATVLDLDEFDFGFLELRPVG